MGIALRRGPDLVVAQLAVLKTGALYLALDPDQVSGRSHDMLTDAGACLVLTDATTAAALPGDLPWLDPAAACTAAPDAGPALPAIAELPDRPACLVYVPGPDGRPRGVMLAHRAVVALVGRADSGSDGACAWHASPESDASTWQVWSALLTGGRVVTVPDEVLCSPGPCGTSPSVRASRCCPCHRRRSTGSAARRAAGVSTACVRYRGRW